MPTPMLQRRFLSLTLGASLALATLGCGPQFDPPSKLQSLRVLAVKKDDPYLRPTKPLTTGVADPSPEYQPDNTAHMALAMQDARLKEDQQGPLQKLWFAGCSDPPLDNYFTCLTNVWLSFRAFNELGPGTLTDGQSWSMADIPQTLDSVTRVNAFLDEIFPGYSQQSGGAVTGPNGESVDTNELLKQAQAIRIGAGDSFDYTVPDWVIEQHAPSVDKDIPRYGLSLVFLAVCDGALGLSPDWKGHVDALATLTDATRGFPLTCYESGTQKERGPDNFMVSYSNLYMYDELKNRNPMIDGFSIDGERVDDSAVCIGEACATAQEPSCDAATTRKVKLCQPGGASDCRKYDISPIVSEAENSELDYIASHVGGGNEQLHEQMWIRYYADLGEIARDTKRLQDANDGWFADHKTQWTVPSKGTGIAHIWSVVYDNRGGVDWARASVCVE
jgi:hypothetical protein